TGEMALASGQHGHSLEEVGVFDAGEHGVVSPLSPGFLPVVVQTEVGPGGRKVVAVTCEHRGEELEHVQGKATDIDLLKHCGYCRLVGVSIKLDGRDVVFSCGGDEVLHEREGQALVLQGE